MEINTHHDICTLFAQLGLPNDALSISRFIQHYGLPASMSIFYASWWTPAQLNFLKTAIEDDADWAPVVDELNELLHRH
jgi:hypothetical protein